MRSKTHNPFFFFLLLSTVFLGSLLFVQTNNLGRNKQLNCCLADDLSGKITNEKTAWFEGKKLAVLDVGRSNNKEVSKVLGQSTQDRWIEVDLSEQKLKAWEGDSLYLETLVSTGLPGTPTPTGEFRIWIKLRAAKMSGGTKGTSSYYYLPNVPYIMYFEGSVAPRAKGFGLHGAYWHNDFGRPKSHGCVNLPIPEAEKLYHWVSPNLPEGKNTAYSSDEDPGTRIVIHE